MTLSAFSRRRRQDDLSGRADDVAETDESNSWLADATPHFEPDDDRSAQYSAWAERMRNKRSAAQAQINGDGNEPTPTYWTTDSVYKESERIEAGEIESRPNPWQIRELLAVLDVHEGATPAEVGAAYKRLAKMHHPDRYVEADSETRELNLERMREINAAYRTLRTLEQA